MPYFDCRLSYIYIGNGTWPISMYANAIDLSSQLELPFHTPYSLAGCYTDLCCVMPFSVCSK